MGNNTISQKIDAYAQANLQSLRQEEAKTGKHLTKYDIAERMVKNKKLTSGELNSWLKTTEGNKECSLSAAQKNALKYTSAWTLAGFGGVNNDENHYTARLENASKKVPKNPVEKQNAISGYHIKLNETVAERKKQAAELQKQIQEQKNVNPNKTLAEYKFKKHVDSVKVSEDDKNKTAMELSKEVENKEKLNNAINDVKDFAEDTAKGIAMIVGSPIAGAIDLLNSGDDGLSMHQVDVTNEVFVGFDENLTPKEKIGELEKRQKQNQNKIADLKQTIAKYEKNMPATFAEYKQREKNEKFLSDITDGAKLSAYKDGNYSAIKEELNLKLQWRKEELQKRISANTNFAQAIYELEMGEQNKTLTPKEQVEFAEKYHLE